jgi:hypothetical protein
MKLGAASLKNNKRTDHHPWAGPLVAAVKGYLPKRKGPPFGGPFVAYTSLCFFKLSSAFAANMM